MSSLFKDGGAIAPPVVAVPIVEALVQLNASEKQARNLTQSRGVEDSEYPYTPALQQQSQHPQPLTFQQQYHQQRPSRTFNSSSGGAFAHHRSGGEGVELESGLGVESMDRQAPSGSRANFRGGSVRRNETQSAGGGDGFDRNLSGGGGDDKASTTPISRVTARSGGIGGPGSRGSGKKPSSSNVTSE